MRVYIAGPIAGHADQNLPAFQAALAPEWLSPACLGNHSQASLFGGAV